MNKYFFYLLDIFLSIHKNIYHFLRVINLWEWEIAFRKRESPHWGNAALKVARMNVLFKLKVDSHFTGINIPIDYSKLIPVQYRMNQILCFPPKFRSKSLGERIRSSSFHFENKSEFFIEFNCRHTINLFKPSFRPWMSDEDGIFERYYHIKSLCLLRSKDSEP